MNPAISVEGLSKKFRLHHQANSSDYTLFQDIISDGAHRLARRLTGKRAMDKSNTDEDFWALKDIGFNIAQGEKVGIIGRNGAGKSTLLKVISRIIEPTAGKVTIRGRVASLLEVGTGFHHELTGRENIYFNGSILGMSRAEIKRRFDEIVAFAEVEQFLDTLVKHYSSGMYVRLGFAIAAHLEPEILIIDEILAVGDAQFQKKCLGKLQEIGSQGRTVMFVSHNMSSILQFTDRTILLHCGKVSFDGDSEEGVRQYLAVNEAASRAVDMEAKVAWLTVEEFVFEQAAQDIGFNQPLYFRLKVRLERPAKDLMLQIVMINSIGSRIVTARSAVELLPKGLSGIQLELPDHRLIPGTYFVGLMLWSGQEMIFTKDQAISLELVADHIDDPLLAPLVAKGKDRWGSYCPCGPG